MDAEAFSKRIYEQSTRASLVYNRRAPERGKDEQIVLSPGSLGFFFFLNIDDNILYSDNRRQ